MASDFGCFLPQIARRIARHVVLGAVACTMVLASVPVAHAQTDDGAAHERIRARIEADAGLATQQREQLREHLRAFERAGLDDQALDALFPEGAPLGEQIRHQQRIARMIGEGLPVEPLLDKLQEGRRKSVPDGMLDRVCDQLEGHVRAADRSMVRAREAGARAGDPSIEHRLTESVARNMWRGLRPDDFEGLMERARERLRDGQCSTTDLAAAAATVTDLMELGAPRERAMELAGEALRERYEAGAIRRMAHMVMAAHAHGRPVDEVMGQVREGMHHAASMDDVMHQMARQGWMGPGEEHGGRGGHSPVDDVIGGPGDHRGGPGGHGGSGGSGGDEHGGGGHGGN